VLALSPSQYSNPLSQIHRCESLEKNTTTTTTSTTQHRH
jgi:hypothetical protein